MEDIKLLDAMDKVTKELWDCLEYGEGVQLNDEYVLSRYSEDDIYVIVREVGWEEVLQVMTDGDGFVFEQL